MSLRHQIAHWMKCLWGSGILAMVALLILSYLIGYELMGKLMEWGL